MNIDQNGIDFIKKWEGGPWLTAKRFGTEKYLTIGFGHYGADVKVGQKITYAEAEKLLKSDIQRAVNHVNYMNNNYKYNFNQNEFNALVSFTYNIGSIYQLTNNGKRTKSQIAMAMPLYNKSGGKVLPGLTNRRRDEQKLFLSEIKGGNTFMIEMEVVKKGSTGREVVVLQTLLRAAGYKGSDKKVLSLDGNAGNNTIYALKNYQSKNGLVCDGCAGPSTWRKLLRG